MATGQARRAGLPRACPGEIEAASPTAHWAVREVATQAQKERGARVRAALNGSAAWPGERPTEARRWRYVDETRAG